MASTIAPTPTAPAVYAAIAAVQAALAKEGIEKKRRNQQQGYTFRGIDDVYSALAPLLAKHGLVILPRVLARHSTERQTQRGGVLFYTTVEVEFDFFAAADGSHVTVRTVGEAMDSADKSTNKAMSAAYKYMAFMAFAIPTEGDNDADGTTYAVAPTRAAPAAPAKPAAPFDLDVTLIRLSEATDTTVLKAMATEAWKATRGDKDAQARIKEAHDKRAAELAGDPDADIPLS